MVTKYNAEIDNSIILNNLHRLIGQIYKLLPYREEGINWEKPLTTIQHELAGMNSLLADNNEFNNILFALECKLESLFTNREDFESFRNTIFECIGKIKMLQDICQV